MTKASLAFPSTFLSPEEGSGRRSDVCPTAGHLHDIEAGPWTCVGTFTVSLHAAADNSAVGMNPVQCTGHSCRSACLVVA